MGAQRLPDVTYYRGLPETAVEPPRGRQFVAGLVVAGTVMLLAEALVTLIMRSPALLFFSAPVTIGLLVTVGALVGYFADRATNRLSHTRASLVFGAAGLVVGTLWGYPIFATVTRAAGDALDLSVQVGGIIGALYVGTTAALGALAGRFMGPSVALRPRWIVVGGAMLLLVAGLGAYAALSDGLLS